MSTKPPERFSEALQSLMYSRSYYVSPGLLAKLSGLPKGTIVNWLEGRVSRPRRWQDVCCAGDAMRLDHDEMVRLLAAAQQPEIDELIAVANAQELDILRQWQVDLRTPPPPPVLDIRDLEEFEKAGTPTVPERHGSLSFLERYVDETELTERLATSFWLHQRDAQPHDR